MRLTASITILFVSVALLTSTAPAAQEKPTFRSNSELVVMHISVRDRGGRYITGLQQDAFTVIDDGKPQTLEMFSSDEVPATVGFLIDNSNSMRPSRERVVASTASFVKNSHPKDEIFVLTFNDVVRRAWPPSIVEDIDPDVFSRRMLEQIVASGMTAIYDGIVGGLDWLSRARHTRQVLIVVSDGGDNASHAKLEDVVKRVHESDATVYSVALVDRLVPRDANPKLMRRLAHATGGEFYQPRDVDDVPDAFQKIAKDIRSAYTLAYIPTAGGASAAERRRRTVRVYVRAPNGKVLTVRTRDGYFEKTREERQ
jgi:Ca-activated chloride channel family protein